MNTQINHSSGAKNLKFVSKDTIYSIDSTIRRLRYSIKEDSSCIFILFILKLIANIHYRLPNYKFIFFCDMVKMLRDTLKLIASGNYWNRVVAYNHKSAPKTIDYSLEVTDTLYEFFRSIKYIKQVHSTESMESAFVVFMPISNEPFEIIDIVIAFIQRSSIISATLKKTIFLIIFDDLLVSNEKISKDVEKLIYSLIDKAAKSINKISEKIDSEGSIISPTARFNVSFTKQYTFQIKDTEHNVDTLISILEILDECLNQVQYNAIAANIRQYLLYNFLIYSLQGRFLDSSKEKSSTVLQYIILMLEIAHSSMLVEVIYQFFFCVQSDELQVNSTYQQSCYMKHSRSSICITPKKKSSIPVRITHKPIMLKRKLYNLLGESNTTSSILALQFFDRLITKANYKMIRELITRYMHIALIPSALNGLNHPISKRELSVIFSNVLSNIKGSEWTPYLNSALTKVRKAIANINPFKDAHPNRKRSCDEFKGSFMISESECDFNVCIEESQVCDSESVQTNVRI